MNLIELYNSLVFPEEPNGRIFCATSVPDYENFKIGIDVNENPVLLLSIKNSIKSIGLKNFRLKYLQLEQNVECKLWEQGAIVFQTFTVITFTNPDKHLQRYFLRISETLIKTLKNNPTQQNIIESLNNFIEIFRTLTDPPTKTLKGLWSELFLIDCSAHPQTLIDYWHSDPEEKFDFNSGVEKIEVKSNSNFERIHFFSSNQLEPPDGTRVLIASIFVRQSNNGKDIQQLVQSITDKVKDSTLLIEKLNRIVAMTLGSSLEQSIKIKFDYNISKESLRFYSHQEISKISEQHIPNEVSEVKYKSDLTLSKVTDITSLEGKGALFSSI